MPDIYETFINHIAAKQDRLRRVMWKWTPAAHSQDIENTVRRTALNVLQLYPDLTADVQEEVDQIVENVGWTIEQVVGEIEVMLNHAPPVNDNPNDPMNWLCAEVRHEATKALLRELVRDLGEADRDSLLPSQPK